MKSESSEATRERAVNVLQLNSALHLVFAYGRTVNVGHLLRVRETFENLPNNGEATT